jgi:acylphosphatase
VAGSVANRWDGSVEAVFEGEEDAVERLVAFMRAGPRGAQVERVEVSEEEPEGVTGFGVR